MTTPEPTPPVVETPQPEETTTTLEAQPEPVENFEVSKKKSGFSLFTSNVVKNVEERPFVYSGIAFIIIAMVFGLEFYYWWKHHPNLFGQHQKNWWKSHPNWFGHHQKK